MSDTRKRLDFLAFAVFVLVMLSPAIVMQIWNPAWWVVAPFIVLSFGIVGFMLWCAVTEEFPDLHDGPCDCGHHDGAIVPADPLAIVTDEEGTPLVVLDISGEAS